MTLIKPNESINVPLELTPEAIERINNGEAVKIKVQFTFPWLSSPLASQITFALIAYGIASLAYDIFNGIISLINS